MDRVHCGPTAKARAQSLLTVMGVNTEMSVRKARWVWCGVKGKRGRGEGCTTRGGGGEVKGGMGCTARVLSLLAPVAPRVSGL